MKNITLMAFSSGQVSKEASSIARYIGVGSVQVVGICPTKAELEKLFNTTLDKDPEYTGTRDDNGKTIQYARIDVVLHTVPENNNGIDVTTRMGLFVHNQYRFNRDQTKIQVIDIYGRTAWVTEEELKNHTIPTLSNGNKANLDPDYRPCYRGEEELTEFFRAFLNIPNPMVYKNNQWVPAENLEECRARFDHIDNLFKGDFSEIKTVWDLQKQNKVKVLFGVRTADDGKQYQAFYTRMFLRNGQSNFDRLQANVTAAKESGAYPTTEFAVVPLQEYKVESSDLSQNNTGATDPFGKPADNPFFN